MTLQYVYNLLLKKDLIRVRISHTDMHILRLPQICQSKYAILADSEPLHPVIGSAFEYHITDAMYSSGTSTSCSPANSVLNSCSFSVKFHMHLIQHFLMIRFAFASMCIVSLITLYGILNEDNKSCCIMAVNNNEPTQCPISSEISHIRRLRHPIFHVGQPSPSSTIKQKSDLLRSLF